MSTVPSRCTVRTCGARLAGSVLQALTASPRSRISTVSTPQKNTKSEPLMNCTQVVETMPAVTTISVTATPTRITPAACGSPRSGWINEPAPTICGIR